MSSSPCPPLTDLQRFLDGELSDSDSRIVDAHVGACETCRTRLQFLTERGSLPELDDALRAVIGTEPVVPLPQLPDIELLEEIGRGGSGRVWKGRLKQVGQIVAVKVLTGGAHADKRQQERFLREAEILSRLRHPGLIRLYHFGLTTDGYFFSMEYLPTGSLADDRERRGQELTPVRRSAEVTLAVAQAVHHAHELHVVHRDLKPGNVLLTADGRPVVADFGAARYTSGPDTTGGTVGTPCYMAPEQATGKPADARSDIYGLGAILYDLLTGRPPVAPGESEFDTLSRVANELPIPPRRLRPDVPADLERVCLKCLEKDPRHRYPTAAALADELGRFLEGKPVHTRPLNPVSAAFRRARRHPVRAGLVAALALALVGGLTAGLFAVRSANAEAETLRERNRRLARERTVGDLLLSSGSLRESVRLTDEMASEGYELTPRQRLHRAEALLELGERGRATGELEYLATDAIPNELRGRTHLLRAGLVLGTDDEAASRWIEAARRELQLAPSDAAFADALVADTTPDAIRHLERAVGLDSRHIPDQSLRCYLLLLSGRLDDAIRAADQCRLLFVDHPTFPTVLALAHGFRGDDARARHALEALAAHRPRDELEALRELVEVLPFAHTELRVRVFGPADGPAPPPPPIHERTVAAIARAGSFAPKLVGEMRLPPKLRPAVESAFGYVRRIFVNTRIDTGGERLIPREELEAYAEVVGRHPEGVATMLYAMGRLESANSYSNQTHPNEFRAELARSAAAYRTAAALPGWIDVRDIALESAAVFYSVAGKPNWPSVTVNNEWIAASADAARQRWQARPITPGKLAMMVRISATAGRFAVARAMFDDLERATPNDPDLDRVRADLEFKAGNFAAALTAAEKHLKACPDHHETTRIQNECRNRLK